MEDKLVNPGQISDSIIKITVSQTSIFTAQCEKYLGDEERIAILNGFPLFLFEYFKISFWS